VAVVTEGNGAEPRLKSPALFLAALVLFAGFTLAGAAAAGLFGFRFPPNHVSNLNSWGIDLNRRVNLEGILVSDPIRSPPGIEFDLEAINLDQAPDVPAGAVLLLVFP
jgi:hypothetical protein